MPGIDAASIMNLHEESPFCNINHEIMHDPVDPKEK